MIIIFCATVFILAYIIRIYELPYYRAHDSYDSEFDEFYNAAYLILITITTVGYGDIYPKTMMGKLTAVFTAIFGAFLISILVLAVGSIFSLTKNQQRALRHIRVSQSSSTAITQACKYFLLKKKLYTIREAIQPQRRSEFLKSFKFAETLDLPLEKLIKLEKELAQKTFNQHKRFQCALEDFKVNRL